MAWQLEGEVQALGLELEQLAQLFVLTAGLLPLADLLLQLLSLLAGR
ncbi:MAG: hypothetical protein V8S34_02285 [Lawsonibacter sp.]